MRKLLIPILIALCFQLNLFSQNGSRNTSIKKYFITSPNKANEQWLFSQPADTITGNWVYIDSLPQPLFGVNSIYLPNINKIFICGGADQQALCKRVCYFYNLNTNNYEIADSLPTGRALGKLVKVRDSLYLVGSVGADFNNPDGMIYMFNPVTKKWQTKTAMPGPKVQECAVCVWHDSVIVAIGGSNSGFSGPTDYVRLYYPFGDTWTTLPYAFYQPTTCSQAECIGENIITIGGWGGVYYNDVINCVVQNSITSIGEPDTSAWGRIGSTPYPTGVYRVSSGQFWGTPVFGSAIYNTIYYNQLWSFNIADSTWRRFLPNSPELIGNIPSISINPQADSVYFYIFGGSDTSLIIINKAERYTCANPLIGIRRKISPIANEFNLYQNYPNPFNPKTIIKFDVPGTIISSHNGKIEIKVYDILGHMVANLINQDLKAGSYEIDFDASNLASGIYIYRMEAWQGNSTAADFIKSKKMILIK